MQVVLARFSKFREKTKIHLLLNFLLNWTFCWPRAYYLMINSSKYLLKVKLSSSENRRKILIPTREFLNRKRISFCYRYPEYTRVKNNNMYKNNNKNNNIVFERKFTRDLKLVQGNNRVYVYQEYSSIGGDWKSISGSEYPVPSQQTEHHLRRNPLPQVLLRHSTQVSKNMKSIKKVKFCQHY